MSKEQRAQVLPVAVLRVSNAHVTMRAAADVERSSNAGETRVKDRMPRAEAWLEAEGATVGATQLIDS